MKVTIEISEEIFKHIDTIQNGSIGAEQVLKCVRKGVPAYKEISDHNMKMWEAIFKAESEDKG